MSSDTRMQGKCEALWFILGRRSIGARLTEAGTGPLSLEVDDPVAVAEKCWDAGYTVHAVDRVAGETRLSIIDPFGRHIELARPEGFRHQCEVHK